MNEQSNNLSKLSPNELNELLYYIINNKFAYRKSLGLNENVTFGIEIEYERMIKYFVDKFIRKNYPYWISKKDESLTFGGEIASPIMKDEIKYWKQIKEICTYLKTKHVITDDGAAGHIHIGAHILGKDIIKWRKFLKTYTIFEDIIFKALYGDSNNPRKKINEFASPISDIIYKRLSIINKLDDTNRLKNKLPGFSKSQAINFMNIVSLDLDQEYEKNTIEFRSPNGTVNENVWQNNINILTKLIINSNNIDEELLDYYINNCRASADKIYTYNEVCLKKALIFSDLIFENEIDKLYFLKQYIKNFMPSSSMPFKKIKSKK